MKAIVRFKKGRALANFFFNILTTHASNEFTHIGFKLFYMGDLINY